MGGPFGDASLIDPCTLLGNPTIYIYMYSASLSVRNMIMHIN